MTGLFRWALANGHMPEDTPMTPAQFEAEMVRLAEKAEAAAN